MENHGNICPKCAHALKTREKVVEVTVEQLLIDLNSANMTDTSRPFIMMQKYPNGIKIIDGGA